MEILKCNEIEKIFGKGDSQVVALMVLRFPLT